MPLSKYYDPNEVEPRLQAFWQAAEVYRFSLETRGKVYSIDTPPPSVSGVLHLGHTYSYTHPDIFARYRRMKGEQVFYPMGYDDNGLPTERLVERQLGVTAVEIGRQAFIDKCLEFSEQTERDYQALWQRLGLSIDWRFTYRTIDAYARRTSQKSFIDLYRKGLVYRAQAPVIWCPECRTAISQAEVNDLERESEFLTLAFQLEPGEILPIATTRPELLPACVAVFIHPEDTRFRNFAGKQARVPLFGQQAPILEDPRADPQKGTGAVMCCTFGDAMDKEWWQTHQLPLIEAITREGRMTAVAGEYAGLTTSEARREVVKRLEANRQVLDRQPTRQTIRVHERCDTPVEYLMSQQWFIRVLEHKQALLAAGEQVQWFPEHIHSRYRSWVENLAWDWCISRQRYFGVPIPIWYCRDCGDVILAEEEQLPVDPAQSAPSRACSCGSSEFFPEEDILDTWATSSMTPQIVGRWLNVSGDPGDHLFERVFPFSLRPQAHDIIRTWAFYTIVKSYFHFGEIPWQGVAISGWGIAGEGEAKISKSRGGGPVAPMEMIKRYSADAVRYWAASTGLGKDAVINEEKIQMGAKLATKLWNVARFSERFLAGYIPAGSETDENPESDATLMITPPSMKLMQFTPADRWILSRTQRLVRRATECLENYDYAAAKREIESFFWSEFADNYLEMAKQRLYFDNHLQREAACFTLSRVLLASLKLFAPFLPFVTEEIYQGLWAGKDSPQLDKVNSIHSSAWPIPDENLEDDLAEAAGQALVTIASAVRRFKSERSLPLNTEIDRLQITAGDSHIVEMLLSAESDLASITRAKTIEFVERFDPALSVILADGNLQAALKLVSNGKENG